jgi:hypothetical protein
LGERLEVEVRKSWWPFISRLLLFQFSVLLFRPNDKQRFCDKARKPDKNTSFIKTFFGQIFPWHLLTSVGSLNLYL